MIINSLKENSAKLQTAQSDSDFIILASMVSADLGYDWLTYCSGGDPHQLITTYPTLWFDHYRAKHYHEVDPVCALTRQSKNSDVKNYSADQYNVWNYQSIKNNPNLPFYEYLLAATSFGIHHGISIRLDHSSTKSAFITLSAVKQNTHLKAMGHDIIIAIKEWGIAFQAAAKQRLARFDERIHLTKQQKHCLQLAAYGQSAKIIAHQLHLSTRTVEFHLEAARKKLEAKNLAHAVTIALTSGQIYY